VHSALGLIRERGAVPSTKEIAEASGVAEGTIFRAFDTKDELIDEVIAMTMCPAPLIRQLHGVDADLPLRDRLVAMVTILQQRFAEIFDLMVGLRLSAPPAAAMTGHHGCTPEGGHVPDAVAGEQQRCSVRSRHTDSDQSRALETVTSIIEPDADLLTCSPSELARYLRLLTFSGSHRLMAEGDPLSPESIVDIVLSGVLDPQPAARRRAAGIRTSRGAGIRTSRGAGIRTSPTTSTGTARTRKAD